MLICSHTLPSHNRVYWQTVKAGYSGYGIKLSSSASEARENAQSNAPAHKIVSCLSTNPTLRRNCRRRTAQSDTSLNSLNQTSFQMQAACREKPSSCRVFIYLNISLFSGPKEWQNTKSFLYIYWNPQSKLCWTAAEEKMIRTAPHLSVSQKQPHVLSLLQQIDSVAASCSSHWLGINLCVALPVLPALDVLAFFRIQTWTKSGCPKGSWEIENWLSQVLIEKSATQKY